MALNPEEIKGMKNLSLKSTNVKSGRKEWRIRPSLKLKAIKRHIGTFNVGDILHANAFSENGTISTIHLAESEEWFDLDYFELVNE